MKGQVMTVLVATGFAVAAFAQEEAAPEEAAPAPEGVEQQAAPEMPKFADIDANDDGRIDQEEAATLAEKLEGAEKEFDFAAADANEDGVIDAAEFEELMS